MALTSIQIKNKFKREGVTFTDWAKKNGFNRHLVYLVLNGQHKANWGKGHACAVALGLKTTDSSEVAA
jgi:gp16 family phage-associated protein